MHNIVNVLKTIRYIELYTFKCFKWQMLCYIYFVTLKIVGREQISRNLRGETRPQGS